MIVGGLIGAGTLALIVGAMVFAQQRRNPLVFFFFLTTLGAWGWAAGIALFLLSDDPRVLVVAAVGYYVAAALIALSALFIGYTLRYGRVPSDRIMVALSVPFLLIAAVLIIRPGVLLESVVVGEQNTATLVPWTYAAYILYFVVYYVIALVLLYAGYMRAKHRRERSASYGYLFAAYAIGGLVGMWFNLFLPVMGDYSLIWVGPLMIVPFIGIVYTAIIRYRLFDVRLALSRMMAYVLSLGVLAGIYIVIVLMLSRLIASPTNSYTIDIVNVCATLLLAFTFQPIKRFFDRVTNSWFYRHRYSREVFYSNLSGVLARSGSLRAVLRRSAELIETTFGADHVTFVIPDQGRMMNDGTKNHVRVARSDMEWLGEWWQKPENKDTAIVVRDVIAEVKRGTAIERVLRSYHSQIALPLYRASELQGLLLLGERRSGRYTPRDFSVLETITDELTIAVQNALSLREVQLLNETLQQRIDEATKELRASNAQLKRLDESKDEFISMASHQLRTPLTSIKGYIDMILDGDAGDITPMQQQFLTEAFVSSERMVHLINDFLNVSRLQTGKFTIEKRPTDLAKIVSQELDGLKINASDRKLAFQYNRPAKIPPLMLDEGKIRQVIMNFADNALYYSRPDTTIKVALTKDDDEIVFTITDTGIGVPKDEQAQLFTKFFRATNARKQRPDGTGVGLYLAKRVVIGHGGRIIFSSTEGKGSTFGFRLPVQRLRVREGADKLDNEPDNH